MITLPASWIYPGKVNRKLVRLNGFEKDSLLHSFLTCVYPEYQHKSNINDRILYLNRFKISLINHKEDYKNYFKEDNHDKILESLSKDFEVNIYLMKCKTDDTIIKKTYLHSDISPKLILEECNDFYPLGINDKYGVHTMFFEGIDYEFNKSIESFDISEISEDYENKTEDVIKFNMKHLLLYDVTKSLKH